MSIDPTTLLVILGMATINYLLRLSGFLIAGRFVPTGRAKVAFDAIPPAVLTAVIAPMLIATGPAETIAGLITAVAAFRLPLLGTIVVGVVTIVALRAMIG